LQNGCLTDFHRHLSGKKDWHVNCLDRLQALLNMAQC
jgi:hypothetical protein